MHLLNGKPNTHISIIDRGLLYGHSVFETVAVHNRKPLLWSAHINRLQTGALKLGIPLDFKLIEQDFQRLVRETAKSTFVLRICLTMGEGGRGYLSPNEPEPNRILSVYDLPQHPPAHREHGVVLGIADLRIASQPMLAGIKHGNRLEQVLARQQWQNDWNEALLLDAKDNVIEATQSNVFIVKNGILSTPDLTNAGVEGVMRATIIELAQSEFNMNCCIETITLAQLRQADEVFLTNSVIGLWPVNQCEKTSYFSFKISHKLLKNLIKNDLIPPV